VLTSVAEPLNFNAAPAPDKNFDAAPAAPAAPAALAAPAAPAAPATTLLQYIARQNFENELKFKQRVKISCLFDSVRFIWLNI
jgi:hypothetical protein